MRYNKTFTIEEARELLPEVKQMIADANLELGNIAERLNAANDDFQECERELATVKTGGGDEKALSSLRDCRARFQESTHKLSKAQEEYEECLYKWINKITDRGIILRDLTTGLIDFPAQKGDTQYLLCWRLDDEGLDYWHLPNDGFIGRRPLAVLDEYF